MTLSVEHECFFCMEENRAIFSSEEADDTIYVHVFARYLIQRSASVTRSKNAPHHTFIVYRTFALYGGVPERVGDEVELGEVDAAG